MKTAGSNVKLSEFVSQVFSSQLNTMLGYLKEFLEVSLAAYRDRVIGNRAYERNSALKRYGYRTRKYLTCLYGNLEQVRLPRIRTKEQEVQYFTDRYVHYSEEVVEQVILGRSFRLSGRQLQVWLHRITHSQVSYVTLLRLSRQIEALVAQVKQAILDKPLTAIVLDGVWFKRRGYGKQVLLVALGVDAQGTVSVLDWLAASRENYRSWLTLLRRLRERGLAQVQLIIGDGSLGLPAAGRAVYPQSQFQVCLWHLCQTLISKSPGLNLVQRQLLKGAFWEVFNAPTLEECYERYLEFLNRLGTKMPHLVDLLLRHEANLFHYYQSAPHLRQRLRTINLAESFFSQLRDLLKRCPGVTDDQQLDLIIGLLWKRFIEYRQVFDARQFQDKEGAFIYAY